ncbi:MAG: enoyl-CoA hydratase [Gammaproteobacteria bacterium]
MSDPILYERPEPAIALVTFNRPAQRNGLTVEFNDALVAALEDAASDDGVRVVIVTGAGSAFCVGADLTQVDDWDRDGPRERMIGQARRGFRISLLLNTMAKPTIAAINGACGGAGLAIACACDLRYAAASARFSTAFANVAMSGDFGGTWTLPRIVGAGKARELYLLGDRFDAAEAARIGLVGAALPDADLLPHVMSIARRLAAKSPVALRGIKANLNDGERTSLSDLIDIEGGRLADAARSEDVLEAARAFLEKRDPVFRGR